MVHAKKMYVSLPGDSSRRWVARECGEFCVRLLFIDDASVGIDGSDRFNEVYFITLDENVYKMSYNQEIKRVEIISGDSAVYHSFNVEEAKEMQLIQMVEFCHQDGKTAPIVKIQALGTLRDYRADDKMFEGLFPALVPAEFYRQQAIVKKIAV